MRTFRVTIETPFVGGDIVEDFEVEDDATEEEIKAEAKEIFLNNCNYGYYEVTDEEDWC